LCCGPVALNAETARPFVTKIDFQKVDVVDLCLGPKSGGLPKSNSTNPKQSLSISAYTIASITVLEKSPATGITST